MNNLTDFHNRYALIIGVGVDLPVTVKDAQALHRLIIDPDRCAYIPQNVKLLIENDATRRYILDALDWLSDETRNNPNSTVMIYFSGHGGYMPHYHLVPYGYVPTNITQTAISGAEFTEKLQSLTCKKLLVLLDCCHAGGITQLNKGNFEKSPLPPEIEQILSAGSGRVVLASSRKDEVSFTGTPYSEFTLALLEALSGYGAAEQDGIAYIADIALYVGRKVPERTEEKQHPILKFSEADNFAVAYYAGGKKTPKPLEISSAELTTYEYISHDSINRHRDILRNYQSNLLTIELQMSKFIDQAAVPPDLERAKRETLVKISEVEQWIGKGSNFGFG